MASLELNKQSCPEHVLKWIENGGQIHYVTSLHRQSTTSFNYQKVFENSSESRFVSNHSDFKISSNIYLEHVSFQQRAYIQGLIRITAVKIRSGGAVIP